MSEEIQCKCCKEYWWEKENSMDLYLLEQIALEAQKQGNIDNVIDAFWTIFSWAGGER